MNQSRSSEAEEEEDDDENDSANNQLIKHLEFLANTMKSG